MLEVLFICYLLVGVVIGIDILRLHVLERNSRNKAKQDVEKPSATKLETWVHVLAGIALVPCVVFLLDELGLSTGYPWSGLWEGVFSGLAVIGMFVVFTEIIIWPAKLWRWLFH